MGTYGLQELIRRWGRDQLTTEQATGQILLLLVELHERPQKLQRRRERHQGSHRGRQAHSQSSLPPCRPEIHRVTLQV